MSGKRVGKWTVGAQAGNAKGGGAFWMCRCDCGNEVAVMAGDLRFGKSTSCGCDRADRTRAMKTTHGGSGSRLHHTWKNMRARCLRPGSSSYARYGGRGIGICPEWGRYETFRDWALSAGYADDLSIDRIDNEKGYEPSNCRWATAQMQSENRRFVSRAPDGDLWWHKARGNGITWAAYMYRLRAGWPVEDATSLPMGTRRRPRQRDSKGHFR